MNRVLLSLIVSSSVTAILCGPDILFASNRPEAHLKQQNSKTAFIENKGQVVDQNYNPNPAVLYLLNTPGMNVQLRKGGFSYDLYQTLHQPSSIQFHRIDIDLLNANPQPDIEASGTSSDYLNYYTTGTPTEGIRDVRSYTSVIYKDVYPRIDLEFLTSEERMFEYNFILHPGADVKAIKMKVYGPEKIRSYREGIRYQTSIGDLDETVPVCYYRIGNSEVPVKGRIKKIAEHLYGFTMDQDIPKNALLVIDPVPVRRWGTYYGGGLPQLGCCATDHVGNVFMSGYTGDPNYIATAGSFQFVLGGTQDAFLVKFSTTGQRLWGTYYGGPDGTQGYGITVDPSGNIYMVGSTSSSTVIASPGAYQSVLRGTQDGFIVKFNTSGQRIWGTYYGGFEVDPPGGEVLTFCSTDTSGNVYCAGYTNSPTFIASPGAAQPNYGGGGHDGFLIKFTPDGQRLWGTYYGGANMERDICCSATKDGYVYLSGTTTSPNNIATPGAFLQTMSGMSKGFLAMFDPNGQRLWGTYYAGESGEENWGCMVDTGSSVYIYGTTESTTNIGTPGVFQQFHSGNGNAYLAKFNSAGQRTWGTYYGSDNARIYDVAVDSSGFVYFTGDTYGQNTVIASPGAYQPFFGGGYSDALLAKFTGSGQRLWGTFYGGTDYDEGQGCAIDNRGNIFICGNTSSVNNSSHAGFCSRSPNNNLIATQNGLYPDLIYFLDGYLVKFSDCWSPDTAAQIYAPTRLCENTTSCIFSIDPILTATDYNWCVTGNLTITAGQHSTSITVDVGSGLGMDTISVYAINACDTGFPKVITRRVYARPVPVISGSNTTCTGVSNPFTTAGGKSNYQWSVSPGGTIIIGGSITDSSCSISWSTSGAHWVRVGYTDTNGCISVTPTQFNVWVNPGLLTSVTISCPSNTVCTGTSITYTAIPVNEGPTPTYAWKVNGVPIGTNSSTFTYIPVNGDVVACQLTSSLAGCLSGNPSTSNSITMTVNPNLPVSVTITPDLNVVCQGQTITFTATPVNEGTTPTYAWKVNGTTIAGATLSTYSYIPVNGDLVSCTVTSSEMCTLTNPVPSAQYPVSVNPNLPVSILITASANPFCLGSSVTFTATPTNGGTTPFYLWKVNGVNAGTNSPSFTYIPANNDQVSCILTSSELCTIQNPVPSAQCLMIQNNSLPAGVNIAPSSNPFCPGSSVTYTATPVNGGSTPSYQWKVNGINTGTNPTYTYNPLNGDSVRCIITSNLNCVTGSPASSAKIIMSGTLAPIVTFTSCFDTITRINAKLIKLKGGIPLGGTYSGPGVNSLTSVFTPALAGVGTHTITYSYTNAALCTASKSISILNLPSSILSCGNALTDPRDNKVYQTVQIGSQCWLASNLNFGTILASFQDQRDNCIAEKYCYNDNPVNCTNHGGLYQWDEVMRFDETPADQGYCPPGWHIPSENDWNILFAVYINSAFAGSPLKYSGYSGFNALLSGARYINRGWDFQGFATFFWSSTPGSDNKAWAHGLNEADPSVSLYPSSRVNAFSVRCLKD
jgi:uncharacterized protein (TIGR02145 family)